MSDRDDDDRKPNYDLTTPNIYPPQQNPRPPARTPYQSGGDFDRTSVNIPAQGEGGRRQPPPPPSTGSGNKYDLTMVNIHSPLGADEDDEAAYARPSSQTAGQQHAPPYTAQYPTADYQQSPPPQPAQPAEAQQRSAPVWARVAGWGLLAFSLLLAGGFVAYLLWPSSGFTLKVLNAPHGSKVFVDDIPMGVSQQESGIMTHGLRPGEAREVRVAHEGYVDWRTTVEGRRGETTVLRVKMTPLPKTESALPEADDQFEQDLEEFGRVRIYSITFDPGSDVIRGESKPPLDRIVGVLKKRTDWALTIEGHTDSTATAQYNQELSQRRAAAVKSYLQSGGIDAARLSTVGYGASKPVSGNDTPVGRALNRRVEFIKK
ncbi:MAG TPA: OmpA family protein [Pyrinomonadaceae bacterium]|nr:OmpA family protein [Pyrinomonadaceae bacterium]